MKKSHRERVLVFTKGFPEPTVKTKQVLKRRKTGFRIVQYVRKEFNAGIHYLSMN